MNGVDEQDERDDLAAYIAKREQREPGFGAEVEAALRARRARRATGQTGASAGSAPGRDLTKIGMHAIARDQRGRYHRNGTQRKRGR
jgi:hypothetical protein